jgi:sterol desaturase/sphingolipid hydroxylase (fatty acid hydroxylase superfamily)
MEISERLSSILLAPLAYLTTPASKTFYLHLATSSLLALFLHAREARKLKQPLDPLASIVPTKVYTHPSAMVDYIYFITNSIVYAAILAPFAAFGTWVSGSILFGLNSIATPHVMTDASAPLITAAFTIVIALVADFGTFLTHYWLHRYPTLWEFHKVHHSAEVLTPITVYRMHPLDDIITLCVVGLLTGVTDALTRFFITPAISPFVIAGLGLATFLFFVTGYHLRHSHIWLSYGPVWSKIFISPAQHQIHHSKARKHWDKNFGFIFSIWDYMYGSLYIPKERETIEFGIGNGEERDYSSPLHLYFVPFKKAWAILKSRR